MGPAAIGYFTAAAACMSLLGAVCGATTEGHLSKPPTASQTVTGEVSTVEGEFRMIKNSRGGHRLKMVDTSYVITTRTGETIRLNVHPDTDIPSRATPGDQVEARISTKGRTLSITRIE